MLIDYCVLHDVRLTHLVCHSFCTAYK